MDGAFSTPSIGEAKVEVDSPRLSKETWVPLPVTHDFTYPSNEEILVNLKVGTSAPCFPISERRNALSDGDDILTSDISPK